MLASGHNLYPRMVLYDLDAIAVAFQTLVAPFLAHFEHGFHVALCPLAFFVIGSIHLISSAVLGAVLLQKIKGNDQKIVPYTLDLEDEVHRIIYNKALRK